MQSAQYDFHRISRELQRRQQKKTYTTTYTELIRSLKVTENGNGIWCTQKINTFRFQVCLSDCPLLCRRSLTAHQWRDEYLGFRCDTGKLICTYDCQQSHEFQISLSFGPSDWLAMLTASSYVPNRHHIHTLVLVLVFAVAQ